MNSSSDVRRMLEFGAPSRDGVAGRGGPVFSLAAGILELAARARKRWERQRRASATRAGLAGLDDHTLRDLGLHRSEIGSIAAEVAGETTRERMLSALSSHGLDR